MFSSLGVYTLNPDSTNSGELQKAHHWAHEARDDCDSWSEPLGPWHLWWQNLVRSEFVEVVSGLHRADIVGNSGVVIELQHSAISAGEIRAREAHYGEMVWLFDATQRFAYVTSDERAFFSVGQTKHLELCKKPVFLDFGFHLIQVEHFTDAVPTLSGFGWSRSRRWFADAFLAEVLRSDSNPGTPFIPQGCSSYPWTRKSPVWKLKHRTNWVNPATGRVITYAKWTEYIKLGYSSYDLIDRHPELANGWTKESLSRMKEFFGATPILLGGRLRLLPLCAEAIPAGPTFSATENLLRLAEEHIQAGRLPVLKPSTKEGILQKARNAEECRYRGRFPKPVQPVTAQRSLFD